MVASPTYNAEGSTTESTGDGERLRRHLKRRKRNWSAAANAIGTATNASEPRVSADRVASGAPVSFPSLEVSP